MCEYKLHVKTCNLCSKYGLKYCFVLRFSPSFMSFYYDLCMHRSMSIWFFEQGGLNDYKSNFLMYIKYLHLVQHHLKVHIATLNFFCLNFLRLTASMSDTFLIFWNKFSKTFQCTGDSLLTMTYTRNLSIKLNANWFWKKMNSHLAKFWQLLLVEILICHLLIS